MDFKLGEKEVGEKEKRLLSAMASSDPVEASRASEIIIAAIRQPLSQGILRSDLTAGIFEDERFPVGSHISYPKDFVAPGLQGDFIAYRMPKQGKIAERAVQGDEIYVSAYRTANAIDTDLHYIRDARWNVVGRMLQTFSDGFVELNNDDAWHVILSAGNAAGFMTTDATAASGYFTKRLVTNMKVAQKRRFRGMRDGSLTDLWISPQAVADMRDWDYSEIDDITRREIFVSDGDQAIMRLYGVNIHEMVELGESISSPQEDYQTYFTSTLSGSLGTGDLELVVGLDLSVPDSFVHPIREDLVMAEDPTLHRSAKFGFYGWMEHGYACLDNRRVILGSF